jgi:hypothetical protein
MNGLLATGGSRGIGAATEAVAAGVRARGRQALVLQADVGDEAAVLAMFVALDRAWGRARALRLRQQRRRGGRGRAPAHLRRSPRASPGG